MSEYGWIGPIEWAAAHRPRPGEDVCGDQFIAVAATDTAALFGVLDGLGHGAPAARAAVRAAEVLREHPTEPLDAAIQRTHRALATTRGAAITLARIGFDTDTVSWVAVGNVTANVLTKRASGVKVRSSALLTGGIVGYRLPENRPAHSTSIGHGDLLVIASDGIAEDHLEHIDFAAPANAVAEEILRRHGKDTDDALVLVARHRGTPP